MAVRESEIHTYFMTIMKQSKDSADPNVINDELIRRYIKQYNAENRIFGMDSMPFTELVELRLSFQNIIKIQNLDGMHKLKKLCLDNNIIDRIEGMDELTSLEWLDLSFNSIKVIEGLDYLTNLTDLSLFHNQISEVSGGLDACHKLNILSLGDNKIATYQQTISYLRNFKKLQVVNFAGNKICEEMYYRSYVIAMLSHLKYLDYTFIRDDERNKALEEHRDDVEEKKAQEQSQEELDKELVEKREIETLNEAFLGCTHNIIRHLQEENEEDEQKVAVLPEQPELFTDFSDKITNDTNDFQESIKKLNSKRVNMLDKFKKSVKKAVDEAEQEDIKSISEFETKEKAAIRVFEQDEDAGEESLKNLLPVVDQLEEKLIDKELELVERVNAAVDNFEKSLKVVIEEIKEEVRK